MSAISNGTNGVQVSNVKNPSFFHQSKPVEKSAGHSLESFQQALIGKVSEHHTYSTSLGKKDSSPVESNTQNIDMTHTTRSCMIEWVNGEIKSGNMSLDEGFPFAAMAMKIPVKGSPTSKLNDLESSEIINVSDKISAGIEAASSRRDQQTLDILRSAQDTVKQSQKLGFAEGTNGEVSEMSQPQPGESLALDDIAGKYDVTNITPVEVDQMVKEMANNCAAPLKDIMMLSIYGAEFRSHMQEYAESAGVGSVSLGTTDYDSRLDEKKNILEMVFSQRSIAQKRGESTENYDSQISMLERMAVKYHESV